MDANKFYRSNQELWDRWTEINARSAEYDVDGFKAGRMTLKPFELEEVGDVRGKSLLHLQCHFGLDTMSWARLGARATGVDFSARAIELAGRLNSELGLGVRFIKANIFDLPGLLDEQFDIVYTSFGVLCWLHDHARWASIVARCLRPGGLFYLAEFHPFMLQFDTGYHKVDYPYFKQAEPVEEVCQGVYSDPGADISHVTYEWPHPPSEIITALLGQGLAIERFREYPFSIWKYFDDMRQDSQGYWWLNGAANPIPLMFSIRARKG